MQTSLPPTPPRCSGASGAAPGRQFAPAGRETKSGTRMSTPSGGRPHRQRESLHIRVARSAVARHRTSTGRRRFRRRAHRRWECRRRPPGPPGLPPRASTADLLAARRWCGRLSGSFNKTGSQSMRIGEPSGGERPRAAGCLRREGLGEKWAERLTCTLQRRGRPRLAAAANGYRYRREDAIRQPGRPGPAVGRCPHDTQRMAKVEGRGHEGRAAASSALAACMTLPMQTGTAEDIGVQYCSFRSEFHEAPDLLGVRENSSSNLDF